MTEIDERSFDDDTERLPDVLDRASSNEMKATAGLVDAIRGKCKVDQRPDANGVYDECGLEIGEQRLRVAIRNLLCVHCASAEEKRKRLHHHNRD
jgi:RNA polymerase-binding transcription factor DksA